MRALLLSLAVLLLAPSAARATMVFQSGAVKPSVYVAEDDGANPRKLVRGSLPHISPDGQSVIYVADVGERASTLREIGVDGGASKVLVNRWQYGLFDWSDDGRYVVATAGRFNRPAKLVVADREAGTSRIIASGYFDGASFAPTSDGLVFAKRVSDTQRFAPVNLFTVPLAGGDPTQITTDGRSEYPLWGPDKIAYTRYHRPTGKHAKDDGPKFNLFTINADGSERARLTNDTVPFLLAGLTPTAWSADGTKLLAQFGGQDTTYAVTVDPATGAERIVGTRRKGFVGTALSKDGTTILGYTNGASGDARLNQVATAGYTGGRISVLVGKSGYPDWTR